MANIGIVGAGIAGLHLGLYLLQRGISATLYTDRSPDEVRSGRLPSITGLSGATRARARELGVTAWAGDDFACVRADMCVKGMPELSFHGRMTPPGLFIDMRIYVPQLIEDFISRGGRLVVSGSLDARQVAWLGQQHDLVVVASGRGGLSSMFPRVLERSPYREPQRRLMAGLFCGIRFPEQPGVTFVIVPGHGEVIESQILTADGPVTGLLVEAIPGGALDPITRFPPEDDLGAFDTGVRELLREHVPSVWTRVEPERLGLFGPRNSYQGAVAPVVRRSFVPVSRGRFAVAIGDAHITHDPILGHGANAASLGACALGEMLVERVTRGEPLDEAFFAAVDDRLWTLLRSATEISNAFLLPPPPHVMTILAAAARNQAVADAFLSSMGDGAAPWAACRTPESAAAFLARFAKPTANAA